MTSITETCRNARKTGASLRDLAAVPVAAVVGEGQELIRGTLYERDYSAGYAFPPGKTPVPGSIARGWRLDPDRDDAAYLCLTDEVDVGTTKGVDDYCFSIRPNGTPTGRFRARLTDTDTGERVDFAQAGTAP